MYRSGSCSPWARAAPGGYTRPFYLLMLLPRLWGDDTVHTIAVESYSWKLFGGLLATFKCWATTGRWSAVIASNHRQPGGMLGVLTPWVRGYAGTAQHSRRDEAGRPSAYVGPPGPHIWHRVGMPDRAQLDAGEEGSAAGVIHEGLG